MIRSLKCKETEKIFNRMFSRKFPTDIQQAALRKLRMLNRATILNNLRVPPSNRLEFQKGSGKGQYCMRINEQCRVCFKWLNGDAFDLEIVDYL